MNTRYTLKNISEKLNISISTVSRALKNHPDISDSTKRKVKELAVLMDYEPNAFAVNLRTNISKVIGLIVPFISNFFYESFIAAVEEEARKSGYTLMILQSGDDNITENETLKLCKQNRVAGILICLSANTSNFENYGSYLNSKIPIIFFDKVPAIESCNKVCLADKEAATMAANTIINHGKKNVLAIFGNRELSISGLRKEAFLNTFNAQAPDTRVVVKFANSSENAYEIVGDLFSSKNNIDLIFCMSDEILIGVMKKAYELKIKIPEKTGILSISNGIIPELFNPKITYIETSGFKLGKLAIKRMFEALNGQNLASTIIQPSVLVSGNSM